MSVWEVEPLALQSSPTPHFLPPLVTKGDLKFQQPRYWKQADIKEETEASLLSQIPHMVRQLSVTPYIPRNQRTPIYNEVESITWHFSCLKLPFSQANSQPLRPNQEHLKIYSHSIHFLITVTLSFTSQNEIHFLHQFHSTPATFCSFVC